METGEEGGFGFRGGKWNDALRQGPLAELPVPGRRAHEVPRLRREQALVLAEALDKLSQDYREVLVLRHLKGLKFPEVARQMGRTTRSVEHLWARAIAEVRRRIGEEL